MSRNILQNTGLGALAAIGAGASFGLGATVCQAFVRQGIAIPDITVAQFIIGTLVLGVFVAARFHDFPARSDVLKLMGLGLLQPLAAITYYFAITYLSVGQAVAIQFQYVWIAVLIQSIVERRFPGRLLVVSSAIILVGTLFASGVADELLGQNEGVAMDPLGFLLAAACAILYALFLYINGRVATDTHPVTRSFLMVSGGAVLATVIFPGFYVSGVENMVASAPAGLSLAVLTGIAPTILLSVAGRRLAGGLVAVLTSTELPAAAISGIIVLGDATSLLMVLGIAMILASVALSNLMGSGSDEG